MQPTPVKPTAPLQHRPRDKPHRRAAVLALSRLRPGRREAVRRREMHPRLTERHVILLDTMSQPAAALGKFSAKAGSRWSLRGDRPASGRRIPSTWPRKMRYVGVGAGDDGGDGGRTDQVVEGTPKHTSVVLAVRLGTLPIRRVFPLIARFF